MIVLGGYDIKNGAELCFHKLIDLINVHFFSMMMMVIFFQGKAVFKRQNTQLTTVIVIFIYEFDGSFKIIYYKE